MTGVALRRCVSALGGELGARTGIVPCATGDVVNVVGTTPTALVRRERPVGYELVLESALDVARDPV